jgi:hypothetical protein
VSAQNPAPRGVDPSTPHIARMYDYWLGGKDNFAADREAAQKIVEISGGRVLRGVRLNRAFLRRAVRTATAAGVRQFLDLGSGLPTQDNVHQVAGPGARVVYADYDPVVRAHGQALLAGVDGVAVIEADLRRPAEILEHPHVRELIDFGEPVAILFVAVLHFVHDEYDPAGLVARFGDAVASGSHLILSHLSRDAFPDKMAETEQVYERSSAGMVARPRAEILRFFDGFELLDPGLVGPTEWRPEDLNPWSGEKFAGLVGVGRKP